MSKHTPGPWINCQAVGQRLSSRRIISNSNKISTVVADVPDYGKTSASERHANARLIAAAPDLLEALQSILDMCNEDSHARDYASRQTEIRGTAIVALRKARGDQDGTR